MSDLEQLARIINQHQLKGVGGGTVTVSWSICTCEHTERTHGNRDYAQQRLAHHQAQAIIDAGWTPPVEPAPTTCADCGEKLIACGSNYPVFKADYTAVIKHEHKEFGRIYPECVNCGKDQQ